MARWEISHDAEKDVLKLTYVGPSGKPEECGTCDPLLEGQLLDWLFSPGQVERFDLVVMKGREFFCQRNARC